MNLGEAFAVELKTGLYGDLSPLVSCEVVYCHHAAGLEVRHEDPIELDLQGMNVNPPVQTQGAMMPVNSMPAPKVLVFQTPLAWRCTAARRDCAMSKLSRALTKEDIWCARTNNKIP